MKKFEEYNIKYRHLARTDDMEEEHVQALARAMNSWPMDQVKDWPQSFVQQCVYTMDDHEEWQQFRCSLKGQSTKMKLARLHLYKVDHLSKAQTIAERDKINCRVDNYLGALVRGGQLNSKHEVQR